MGRKTPLETLKNMIWDQLTYVQIEKLDRNIPVLLSISATEQHGAHLPLATDRLIGEHFAKTIHEAIPDKVLILPSVGIGCSTHHMNFSGSLTLSHQTFKNQVVDIIESVIHHGFKKIVLLNSHGGNQGIGQVIIEKLGHKHKEAHFVLATWWHIAADELNKITESGKGGTGHAGEFETSLMYKIAPELVHVDKIKKGDNQPNFDWADGDMMNSPKATYYKSIDKMTPNGVFGDPSFASPEKGEKIIEAVNNALIKIVTDIFE